MTKKESKPLRYDARKGWVGGRPDTLYTFTDKLTGATRISDVPTTAVGPNCTWREATPQEADTFPGRGWRNQTKANAPKKDEPKSAPKNNAPEKEKNAPKKNATFTVVVVGRGDPLASFVGKTRDDALEAAMPDDGDPIAIYEGVVAPDAASARLPAYYRKVKPVRGRFEYSGDE